MKLNEIKKVYDENVMPNYTRQDICLVKGDGAWVEDSEGK
jgi:acetylornithine/succinyldiaminopimelate/putrescine aminotransferase